MANGHSCSKDDIYKWQAKKRGASMFYPLTVSIRIFFFPKEGGMFPTKRKSTYREKRKRKSRVLNKLKVMQSTAKCLHRTSKWVTWLCASGGTSLQGPQSAWIRVSSSVRRQGQTRRLTQCWEGPRPLRLSCGRWHRGSILFTIIIFMKKIKESGHSDYWCVTTNWHIIYQAT